mgnify:CR=1 FL=1|jgi:hypothetical protein
MLFKLSLDTNTTFVKTFSATMKLHWFKTVATKIKHNEKHLSYNRRWTHV